MSDATLYILDQAGDKTRALSNSRLSLSGGSSFPILTLGDQIEVDVYFIDSIGAYTTYSGDVAGTDFKLAVGNYSGPTTGTFTATFGADTTADIQANATAESLETALNALASITTAGGVDVLGNAGGPYKITFRANGAQSTIAIETKDLEPSSAAVVLEAQAGDVSTREIQLLSIRQDVAVYNDTWTAIVDTDADSDTFGDNIGFRGTLDINTVNAYIALAGAETVKLIAEAQIQQAGSGVKTKLQAEATLKNQIISIATLNPVGFPTFLTEAAGDARYLQIVSLANTVFVAKDGNDSTGARGELTSPFLTVTAAEAAAVSGDTILVYPGDYTTEAALAGKDGVTYQGLGGAIMPAFDVQTAITIKGSGLCQYLFCHAGAVMDMPYMDTVDFIYCNGGTQTVGNAGTYIQCDDGTQTAGNAGTYIQCYGGTQTAGNAGSYIQCNGGTQTLSNGSQSHDGTTAPPINLSVAGNLTLKNYRSESTESDGVVVEFANSWSGAFKAIDCEFVATNSATVGTIGIKYGTAVTGNVQLKNCTIITDSGTGTAKSIDAPSAQTVYVQGALNETHDVDADITTVGGDVIINTDLS